MLTTDIQVFNLTHPPAHLATVADLQRNLGEQTTFEVEGASRAFDARVLSKIDNINDLLPTFTITHKRRTLKVSLPLLKRISGFFREKEDSLTEIKLSSRISRTALKYFIDYSQGKRLDLGQMSHGQLGKTIHAANRLEITAIQRHVHELIKATAAQQDLAELIRCCETVCAHTSHFDSLFGSYFSGILQTALFRYSQYTFNAEEQASFNALINCLTTYFIPLKLDLSHWKPTPVCLNTLRHFNILKLDFRDCSGLIDLGHFPNLVSFKGVVSHSQNYALYTSLRSLELDQMPHTLPPRLKKLHVLKVEPAELARFKKIPHFSFESEFDTVTLPEFPGQTPSLQLRSTESLNAQIAQQIQSFPLRSLCLNQVRFSPWLTNPPVLDQLQEAILDKPGNAVLAWICLSTRLERLTLVTTFEEDTLLSLPTTLRRLELTHSNDRTHTANAKILTTLAPLTLLNSLKVSGFDWLNAGFQFFDPLTSLQELVISVEGAFFPNNLTKLQSLTNLRKFSVESGKKWPTELPEIQVLATLPLTHLKFKPAISTGSSQDESDETLTNADLSEIGRMTSLIELNMSGTTRMNEMPFVSHLTRLEVVNLSGCRWLTSLRELTSLPNLRVVHHTLDLTAEDRAAFFRAIPSLERMVGNH